MVLAWFLVAACGGAPEPTLACCTVDDVLRMHGEGVAPELIVTAIQASPKVVTLSADDVIALGKAGVHASVVAELTGVAPGDDAPGDDAPPAASAASPDARGAASPASSTGPATTAPSTASAALSLTADYEAGASSFRLTNTGARTGTGCVLTANGTSTYALPVPLKPGNPDSIRLGSFVARDGERLSKGEGLRTLTVRCEQGAWSRSF